MRTPSSTMRLRTTALVSDRKAALIWRSASGRSAKRSASSAMISLRACSSAATRSALSDRDSAATTRAWPASATASNTSWV